MHIVRLPLETLYQIWLYLLVWFYFWRKFAFFPQSVLWVEIPGQGEATGSYSPSVTMDGVSHVLFSSTGKEVDQTSSGMLSIQISRDSRSQRLCFQGSSVSGPLMYLSTKVFLGTINMYCLLYAPIFIQNQENTCWGEEPGVWFGNSEISDLEKANTTPHDPRKVTVREVQVCPGWRGILISQWGRHLMVWGLP